MTEPSRTLAGRRVVVTGAAGFLGSHVARRLVAEGAEVHAVVRRAGGRRLADVATRIREHEVDVTDATTTLRCIGEVGPEVVIHLAADTAVRRSRSGDWALLRRSIDANVVGTLNVLHAALESGTVRVFLRAGGLEEYGNGPVPYDEGQREQPVSPYSASQVAATHYCQVVQQHADAAIVTLRPALLYGPAQADDFFIPALIRACLRGEDFPMASGVQRRDLLYVDDAVEGFVRAACRPDLRGAVVNLGHGHAHAMTDVARQIVAMTGAGTQLRIGALPDRRWDIVDLVAGTDAARRLLDWKPEVGLGDGLERTVAWYRADDAVGTAT